MTKNIRNIAIIAHIDHGKTTLIDKLLQQTGMLDKCKNITERIMDFNDLEKERGITIVAKNATIHWRDYRINIIDTPGHADFGGEVERIMSMVDSVLLVVDAIDGPMPQTRFVTKKAFSYNLKPIVIINKIDRNGARPDWVVNQVFDLFIDLGANDKQLDFPIIYTSAINGISGLEHKNMTNNMTPLLESIINNVDAPNVDTNGPFQMQISQLEYNKYVGFIGIGRIKRGSIKANQNVTIVNHKGKYLNGKINQILGYLGLQRTELSLAQAGEIIAIIGLNKINISDTICDPLHIEVLPSLRVDEPTIEMSFNVNTSPFCGKEGKYITSRQILERLNQELIYNISLQVHQTEYADSFRVSGRGIMHLTILIETMRREGFEIAISRPQVIFKTINGIKHEPFELVTLEINEKHQGVVMQAMGVRKGKIRNILPDGQGRIRLDYVISSRGLIGFRTFFLTITSGTGLFYSIFSHYDDMQVGIINQRQNGVLISNGQGKAVAYALYNLQNHGDLLLDHGTEVYEGQIIGIHKRSNDLTVNCLTGKKLTNMRASGTDEASILIPVINISLEQALEFINVDELVEVTPQSVRLRKRFLSENERKRINR